MAMSSSCRLSVKNQPPIEQMMMMMLMMMMMMMMMMMIRFFGRMIVMKKWCFVKSDLPPQEKLLGLFGFYHVKASLCPLKYAKLPSHQEVRRRVARVVWVDEKRPDDGKEPTAMRCGPVSWFLKTIFLDGGFSVEILGAFFSGVGHHQG